MLPTSSTVVASNASHSMGSQFSLQGFPRRVPDWHAVSRSSVVSLVEAGWLGCGTTTAKETGLYGTEAESGAGVKEPAWSSIGLPARFGWGASGRASARTAGLAT